MVKSLRKRIAIAIAGVFSVTAGVTSIPSFAFAADYEDVTQDGTYVGRTFNADFDTMLEDFSAVAPADTSANYVSDGVLSVTYDGDEDSNTMDAAVYKVASGIASSTNAWPYQYLVYEMSSPDGSAKLSELGVYLRELENKSFTEAPVPFDEEFLDSSSAKEIGTEKTKIVVDLKSYVTNAGLTSMLTNGLAGYHLVALPGQTGTVVLHDVYLTNEPDSELSAQDNAILADFEKGQTAGDADKYSADIYWCGSEVGKIIPKHVELAANASYEFAEKSKEQTNVVITAQTSDAATFDLTIGDVTKSWAELKGPDGAALTAVAADTYFKNVVVNLKESGFAAEKTAGELTVTAKSGELNLVNAFLTDMEIVNVPADRAFPILDSATASKIDDFTFGQTAITDQYDDMVKVEAMGDSQLAYRMSYANGDKLSVKDGMLTLDATAIGTGYINFKTQSTKTFGDYQYLVFKMKASDGADLSGFRFITGKDGATNPAKAVWGNGGLKSGVKLSIAQLGAPGYPYTKDGWQYVMVDLVQSGLTVGDTIDMYYSGKGKLSIDEMFYCNALAQPAREVVPHVINDTETVLDASESPIGYQPVWGGGEEKEPIGKRFLTFEAKGTGAATLNECRFEFSGTSGVYWIGENAQGVALGMDGKRLPSLTQEYQTYVVDLEKSGVADYEAISKITLHATLAAGTVSIKNFGFTDEYKVQQSLTMFDTETKYDIGAGDAYSYVTYVGGDVNNGAKALPVMAITLKGNATINENQLRFELKDTKDVSIATLWWKENAAGNLRDLSGNLLGDITEEYQTFYIDLGAYSSVTAFHIHGTQAEIAGELTIKEVKFLSYDKLSATDFAAPTFDNEKPVVTITTAATAEAGDKIAVTYTATDNLTASADLTVESVTVTKNGTPVTLDANNAFTAEEGTYVITVTVSDAEGNIGVATKTITVSAKTSANEGVGSGCGCGGAIGAGSAVVGSAVLLGAMGFMLARKRKHSDKK